MKNPAYIVCLIYGKGQNLLGTRARTIDKGAKTLFFREKKGYKSFFRKKSARRRLIFNKKGAKVFFSEKNKGAKTFFRLKKGGDDFFFRQIFPQTRPRYPLNFDQSFLLLSLLLSLSC